jgi:hypothetical protein
VELTVARRRTVDGQHAVNFTVTSSVNNSTDNAATGG